MLVSEIDPLAEVTVTLYAAEMLAVGSTVLSQASHYLAECERAQSGLQPCGACSAVAMEMQRTGLKLVQAVADAGEPIGVHVPPPNNNVRCPHGLHFNGAYCEECNP